MISKDVLDMLPDDERKRVEGYFNFKRKPAKQSPANALTDAIIKYVRSLGGSAARINVMGIYDQKMGKYRTSGSTKGVEDVDCTKPIYVRTLTSDEPIKIGLKVAVEVKIGADKQSEHQIKRQAAVESAGGVYIIAKTFDQFKEQWDKIHVTK